jgi:DNA-directed RNA polymerase subunit omega
MSEKLEGIVSPAIDNLMTPVGSKYELVIFASKRARQINDYYSALHEGSLFNNVGPLVDATVDEKPLTIAMHEIDQNKLEKHAAE